MDPLEHEELRITVSGPDDGALRVDWTGKSNDRRPREVLDPFFRDLLDKAAADDAKVEMHFEALDYFNSSTITALIQMIQDFRAKQRPLKISFDGKVKWQRLSFEALRIFEKGDGLIGIEEL